MFDISTLNYLAILVAAIVSFAIGSLWYTALFGKIWQKEVGLSDTDLAKGNMALTFGGSFILMILMSFGLSIWLKEYSLTNTINWQVGAIKGLIAGLLFILPSIGINLLYQRKSLKLFLVDGGYQLLFMIISGIILALWR